MDLNLSDWQQFLQWSESTDIPQVVFETPGLLVLCQEWEAV